MYFLLPSSKPKLGNISIYKISTTSLWDYPTIYTEITIRKYTLTFRSTVSIAQFKLFTPFSIPFPSFLMSFSGHSLQILAAGSNILSLPLSLFLPTHLCASIDTSPAVLPFRSGITLQLLNTGLSAAEKKKDC